MNPIDAAAPPTLRPEVLTIIRRYVKKNPNRAAGLCERTSDRLRWRLIEHCNSDYDANYIHDYQPHDVKVISGWYRPAAPPDRWADVWSFGHADPTADLTQTAIDHTWVWIKNLGLYIDPTIAQFGDGENGLQIARVGDPRYLLIHPATGEKAFHYVNLAARD